MLTSDFVIDAFEPVLSYAPERRYALSRASYWWIILQS